MNQAHDDHAAGRYAVSLQSMVDALFRPTQANGYWSDSEGRIIRALRATFDARGVPSWQPDREERYRYVPMALMGVASWRTSPFGHDHYDEKILKNLQHYAPLLRDEQARRMLPSYGVGPLIYTYARLHDLWPAEGLDLVASHTADFALDRFSFRFNEDALVLMGVAALGERLSPGQRNLLRAGASMLRSIQDGQGLYRTREHPSSFKHQNQMYTIWGLTHADRALGGTACVSGVRRCLEYTIEQRMQPDGALLWHHYRNPMHRVWHLARTMADGNPEHACLYSCHQAFFIYAVQQFRALSGDQQAFTDARDRAIDWLYGQNVLREDLFAKSGIGVPMRMMLTSGKMDVPGQRFVGAYEIGGMILAMLSLLREGAAADSPRRDEVLA